MGIVEEIVEKPETRISTVFCMLFVGSFVLVLSLALNEAFSKTFALIPIPQNSDAANAWIYVLILIPLIFLVLIGMFYLSRTLNNTKSGSLNNLPYVKLEKNAQKS